MPRTAYEVSTLLGFNTKKVTSIAVVSAGERLFVGTADGSLVAYECRGDTPNALRAGSFECRQAETLRKGLSKDRKPVIDLLAVEAWRALLGILDGQLVAYDLYTYRPLASVPETRGASCFCVDEAHRLVYIAHKKRLQVLVWQAVSLAPQREFPLPETPRTMALVPPEMGSGFSATGGDSSGSPKLVMALRKEYSVLDCTTGTITPALLLTDRDQLLSDSGQGHAGGGVSSTSGGLPAGNGIVLPVPASAARGSRVLLSSGSRGLLVDLSGRGQEERLSWSAPPLAVRLNTAFLVATLIRQVEVHDLASLAPLQTIDVSGAACMTGCPVGGGRGEFTYVATGGAVNLLKLIPIEFQVMSLVDAGSYEEALSLCAMCKDKVLLGSVDVRTIHERCAYELFSWGDYEGAVGHFLSADTAIHNVASLFPSLFPPEFAPPSPVHPAGSPADISSRPLTGVSLSRAATALVHFLESHRKAVLDAADREECQQAGEDQPGPGERAGPGVHAQGEAVRTAVLLDTLLLSARMHCSPVRHNALVEQLSGPNRCHSEACAPLLAAGGPPFMEALLWLHRGRGRHWQALALMAEERCVAGPQQGGWTRHQFHRWWAEYLRWLWLSENEAHPPLVLQSAGPLLEADPALGLSVFTSDGTGRERGKQHVGKSPGETWGKGRGGRGADAGGVGGGTGNEGAGEGPGEAVARPGQGRPRPGGAAQVEGESPPIPSSKGRVAGVGRRGGKGIPPQEVVAFLKAVTPRPTPGDDASAVGAGAGGGGGADVDVPLTNGRALAIKYLEHLVAPQPSAASAPGAGDGAAAAPPSAGSASPALHDELAYLLMEGFLVEQGVSGESGGSDTAGGGEGAGGQGAGGGAGDGAGGAGPGGAMTYRKRLQMFLQTSTSYNPARLLAVVPSHFLHEHALLLSRLGRHEEVLNIYVRQLKNQELAEAYCARIWEASRAKGRPAVRASAPGGGGASGGAAEGLQAGAGVGDEDVYICLLRVYLTDRTPGADQGTPRGLAAAISLLERHFDRVDPARALALLPPWAPLASLLPFIESALRHADTQRRTKQMVHQLSRADYVNVKYELIQLQSRVSRVPALAMGLSFAHLGRVLQSCPPVELTDPTADYSVNCVKHVFETHVVLQFNVTNNLRDHRLYNVTVRVECSDPDLYTLKTERALPALPPHGTGSCYAVLVRSLVDASPMSGIRTGGGVVPALFTCELRFSLVREGQGHQDGPLGSHGGFTEEYALEDLELTALDYGR